MSGNPVQSADLGRLLEPYWRRRWLVLAILLIIPGIAYGLSKLATPVYETSTTLLVRGTNFGSEAFTDQISYTTGSASAAARLVETTTVAEIAADNLGLPESRAGGLLSGISAEVDSEDFNDEFLTINSTSDSPRKAANVANAFAEAITTSRTDEAIESIDDTIAELEGRLAELQPGPEDAAARDELVRQIQQLEGLRSTQEGTTQVIEPASVPGSPISPKPVRNTVLGLLLAVLVAAGAVPLADRFNRRLREPEELPEITGSQLLAMIPESAFPGHPPSTAARESFQTLRAALRYFNLDNSLGVVLITSPSHGEGKTTVAANLAVAMARDGQDVILLDTDLRRPRAAVRLGVQSTHGIEAVLMDNLGLDQALETVSDGSASFKVLASTSPTQNPAVLLSSGRMRELLAELAERSDIVIVDTPPLLTVSDAIPLIEPASGIVLVSRVNHTKVDAITRATEVIDAAGGQLLGTVVTATKGSGLYGYDEGEYYEAIALPPKQQSGDPDEGPRLLSRLGRRS